MKFGNFFINSNFSIPATHESEENWKIFINQKAFNQVRPKILKSVKQ